MTIRLQWRHSERDGVSNHRRPDRLLRRLFRHRSNLPVTGLWEGNLSVTDWFPSQRDSKRKMLPFDDVIMSLNKVWLIIGTKLHTSTTPWNVLTALMIHLTQWDPKFESQNVCNEFIQQIYSSEINNKMKATGLLECDYMYIKTCGSLFRVHNFTLTIIDQIYRSWLQKNWECERGLLVWPLLAVIFL